MYMHEKILVFKIWGIVQIFVDFIFDLQSGIENKILSKITGYTVLVLIVFIPWVRAVHYNELVQ